MTAGTSSSTTGVLGLTGPGAVQVRAAAGRAGGAPSGPGGRLTYDRRMTAATTATTSTADGRTLAFCEWGDPKGTPVFSLHGTPGSRVTRHPDAEVYRRAGVRAITYDRAGYGLSTRLPGRSIAHAAADVATIADALGIERFAVTGGSGGAPHSLACGDAASRPRHPLCQRRRAGAVRRRRPGARRLAARHGRGQRAGVRVSLAGEDTLRPELQRETDQMLSSLGRGSGSPVRRGV